MIEWIAKDIVHNALQKVVDDTENPYDNMLMATVEPMVQKELEAYVDKKIEEYTA